MAKISHKLLRQQLADAIIEDLRKGTWDVVLPGLRSLAARYGVSKRTCAEALEIVEKKGCIEPAVPRTRRKIRMCGAGAGQRGVPGQLLIISDLSSSSTDTHLGLVDNAGRFWTERGGFVRHIEVDYTRRRSPAKLLRDWFEGERVECVLLIQATMAWTRAIDDLGVPVFHFGGFTPPKMKNSVSVGFPMRAAVVEALEFLKQRGHHRILMPYQGTFTEMRKDCIAAVHKVFEGISESDAEAMVPAVDLVKDTDWGAFWSKALVASEPTCVIVGNSLVAVSLVSFCASAGIRIPNMLSIFVFDGTELIDWFVPPLAHLKMDDDSDWKNFRRWVNNGFPLSEDFSTRFRLIPGASVARLDP